MAGDEVGRPVDKEGERLGTETVARGIWGLCMTLLAITSLSPNPLEGQTSPAEVAERCGVESEEFCYGQALALQAARAGIGLAAAGGTALPTTTGTRGDARRFTVAFSVGRTRSPVHSGVSRFDTEHESATITTLRAALGVDVFDGWQLAPDVRGVLSLDLMADFSWVRPPNRPHGDFGTGDEFPSRGFGIDVGIGLLGESSSRPGVTVRVARRWISAAHYTYRRDSFEFGNAWTDFETVVTSVRGVLEKSLSGGRLVGGMGWDRYDGDAILRTPVFIPDPDASDLRSERVLFFAGFSREIFVLELSGQAGWARGFDDEPTVFIDTLVERRFDPSRGTFWASLGLEVGF